MPVILSVGAIISAIALSCIFYFAGGLDGFAIGWAAILSGLGVVFAFITMTLSE